MAAKFKGRAKKKNWCLASYKENLCACDANICVGVPALLILKAGEECEEDVFVLKSINADKALFRSKVGIVKQRSFSMWTHVQAR